MHMVAGAVSRRLPGSKEPFLGRKRGRRLSPAVRRRTRRRVDSQGLRAQTDTESSSTDSNDAASVASSDAPGDSSDATYSDAGTDDTLSGGEEAEDDAPVPTVSDREREYKDLFGDMPTHDAVLEVVCLAASLMGKLCGDNKEEGYSMTQSESEELANDAYSFVTKYVRVLFGPVNTTKMHTLAYHLLDELLLPVTSSRQTQASTSRYTNSSRSCGRTQTSRRPLLRSRCSGASRRFRTSLSPTLLTRLPLRVLRTSSVVVRVLRRAVTRGSQRLMSVVPPTERPPADRLAVRLMGSRQPTKTRRWSWILVAGRATRLKQSPPTRTMRTRSRSKTWKTTRELMAPPLVRALVPPPSFQWMGASWPLSGSGAGFPGAALP